MALTKTTVNDKIEVINQGDWSSVQVRTVTIIAEDGVEISRNFHRHVVAPGDDYSQEDAQVQVICAAVHTEDVVAAYKAMLEKLV